MPKRWRIRPHDPARIAQLQRAAGIPAVVAQLLTCRGVNDPAEVRRFLEAPLSGLHDPAELPGVPQAAKRLLQAVRQRRRIVVYGDYDVDGVCATSILLRCLSLLGGDVRYHIPCRLSDGYGVTAEALEQLAADGAQLVVTVDCGITSCAEAALARRLGLELIVTDHHEPGAELPDAAAIVHPRLPGHRYRFGGLCGAAVAFKLAWALCQMDHGQQRVSTAQRQFLRQALELAALGTVADVVPLLDENRILVRHGLQGLRRTVAPGLRALLQVAGLDQRPRLDAQDIGFSLAPRLNAAGRLGQARLAVELLITPQESRALELAQYIDGLNTTRQTLERSTYLAAVQQLKERFDPQRDPAIVLAQRGWHPGVIGIVAGRLAEKYHRPVVMVALDEFDARPGTGSCRSVPGFDIVAALRACGEHLQGYGGHAAAAGLRIDPRHVDAFREAFFEYAAAELGPHPGDTELHIDAETPLAGLTLSTLEQIEQMAPFGTGNERPLLCTTGVRLAGAPRKVGAGQRHLQLRLTQGAVQLPAVAFGAADWAEPLADHDGPLAVAFHASINHFRGRRSVQLELADWQPAPRL